MSSKRIVMPGGSGFLGRHLTERLTARGDEVVIFSRGEPRSGEGWRVITWDGVTPGPWEEAIDGADAIVHLSGKRVDCLPTKRNLRELIDSRVVPVRTVAHAWRRAENAPPVWVQLSSLARYGDSGDEIITESTTPTSPGPPQMVEVCTRWEAAFAEVAGDIERPVVLRPAIGIGGQGDPATERLVTLTKLGLGGKIGSGRQWVSWIGLEDFMRILLRAIDDDTMTGTYHVTSPNPVTNTDMMAAYRKALGRRFGLPSPAVVARVGALVLGSDPNLALTGRRGVPQRLLDEGYEFVDTDFETVVRNAVDEIG